MIVLILIALFCCIFGNPDELSDEELYFLMEEERRENERK